MISNKDSEFRTQRLSLTKDWDLRNVVLKVVDMFERHKKFHK